MNLAFLSAIPGLISVLALTSTTALAERRVALVIGNSAYTAATTLANPANDAIDIAAAFNRLGVEVVTAVDLDKRGMEQKIREFADLLTGADVGIFFYAGHGLQVDGHNYLVPVDAMLSTPSALDFEMVRLDLVQRAMEAGAKTNIIFLDACRDNPLARNLARAMGIRSAAIGRGLAPAESGVGTLVSFSTQPGNVALDGSGRNSPYTAALKLAITVPGEDVLSVLTTVRNEVLDATNDRQVPWENHALRARFYFNGPPSSRQEASAADREWAEIDKSSAAEIETFLARHGDSPKAPYAKARLAALQAQKAPSYSSPITSRRTPEEEEHLKAKKAKEEQEALAAIETRKFGYRAGLEASSILNAGLAARNSGDFARAEQQLRLAVDAGAPWSKYHLVHLLCGSPYSAGKEKEAVTLYLESIIESKIVSGPARADVAWTPQCHATLQRALLVAGAYNGPVDGKPGRINKEMLLRYCNSPECR